jgi:hypothetical protein
MRAKILLTILTLFIVLNVFDHSDTLAFAKASAVSISYFGKPVTVGSVASLDPTEFNNPNPGVDLIKKYIREKFGTYADKAECIASHESNFRVRAIGYNPPSILTNGEPSYDKGVFQLNSYWHPLPDSVVYNWKDNIDIAYQISNHGTNWDRWSTKHFCL